MNLTKKRWIILVASCLINLCIGSLYAWSVFATPMAEYLTMITGNKVKGLAIIFTIANSVGPVTMISGGAINDKLGPKWVIFIGGLLFGGGMILSGFATGVSWLCYFKALQLGDVNKVVPIDKSSTILTMVLAFIFLGENITINMVVGMIGIGIGTYLMIQKKESIEKVVKGKAWLVYALLSAIFASLTSILGKVGIENVESNLGTAIRTIVVLIMAWIIVFATKKQSDVKKIDKKSLLFLILSGIATGASWLCYYKALQDGLASIVVPIDKLSILVTILFAYVFLKEKLSKKSIVGLVLIVVGTLILLIKI